jgi:hypothetical protein
MDTGHIVGDSNYQDLTEYQLLRTAHRGLQGGLSWSKLLEVKGGTDDPAPAVLDHLALSFRYAMEYGVL